MTGERKRKCQRGDNEKKRQEKGNGIGGKGKGD